VYVMNTGNYFTGKLPLAQQFRNIFFFDGFAGYLTEFVFHSPSEHLINGRRYDLELQLTHEFRGLDATYITSIFFSRNGKTNPFLEQLVYDLPDFSDCTCGNGRVEKASEAGVTSVGFEEECDNGGRNSNASQPVGQPNCCRKDCKLPRCGDGVVDVGEGCDLGEGKNRNVSGVCRTTCCLPACGDGIVDPGEQCDDGNRHNLDGCSSICLFECGDGETNFRFGLEQCDNGANNSNTTPDACRTNCRLPTCGDGTIDNLEACDDGRNGINPSQCRIGCAAAPKCGDGITDLGEYCDDGATVNGPGYYCSSNCTSNCGDGVIQVGEECDDGPGNSDAPDASCRTTCQRAWCGDGIIDPAAGEQCDSGYVTELENGTLLHVGNWWCSWNCTQMCGSGLKPVNTTKECDHGCYNADAPNRCRTTCLRPVCGDAILDTNETCDHGVNNSNSRKDACRMDCRLPRCGDGVVDSDETCDDENHVAGDGCDPTCRLECGNGNLETGEECDLGSGNANTADNCRTNCKLPRCGDGIVDTLEECDSGTANSDTSPNACRTNCRVSYCGDGVIDTANGEKCDAGSANSDTEPNGCSLFCIPNYCRQRLVGVPVDFSLAVPGNHTAYSYYGTKSVPPCKQLVVRLIFDEVQSLSDHQFYEFTTAHAMPPNNRPVKPRGINQQVDRPCALLLARCGNGVQEGGEDCDLGLMSSDTEPNRCRTNCRLPTCGDSVTDRNEECDDGPMATARCGRGCRLNPVWSNPFAPAPWSYRGACSWGMTSPAFASCAGSAQSPINIVTSRVAGSGDAQFALPGYTYGTSTISFVNRGKSLALLVSGNHVFNGATLRRIEFHSPSEHTVNGLHADLEAQLLHTSPVDGSWVAVALLFNRGQDKSAFLSQFDFYVPKHSTCARGNGGVEQMEECDDGDRNSDSRPNTCRRDCRNPYCGDGVVDAGEQCDDGLRNSWGPNGCRGPSPGSRGCVLPTCGDGTIDDGEECDSGTARDEGCSASCKLLCGNGIIDHGEECDNGPANSDTRSSECLTTCRLPWCGDGVLSPGEECDDGFFNGQNGLNGLNGMCRAGCRLPRCGDQIVDVALGEECDSTTGCTPDCLLLCGNGQLDPEEECDDGVHNSNTDGKCRTSCRLPFCGDGVVDVSRGEQCDPTSTDFGCTTDCKLHCGDGVVDVAYGEKCDDGTLNDDTTPGACRTNCQLAYCGDGVKEPEEECDFGTQNGREDGDGCRPNCRLPSVGDGVVDVSAGEQCDDGNTENGDGCDFAGKWECGNGRRDEGEECDEGVHNSRAANGCRPRESKFDFGCQLPRCGDGIVDDGEECDSGFTLDTPGCRADCTLPRCGDGLLHPFFGEECDDGELNDDFSLTGCSTSCTLNGLCGTCQAPATRPFNLASAFWDSPVATYRGSLTTPPCTENVTWYVFTQPASVSAKQLAIFTDALGTGNFRPVQPLNGRAVTWTKTAGAVCGNCKLEGTEECDNGGNNADQPDKCRTNCKRPKCGDGIVDSGEECDLEGANSPTGMCDLNCKMVKSCPAIPCNAPGAPATCTGTTHNNKGTIVNVNFARLLKGLGCRK